MSPPAAHKLAVLMVDTNEGRFLPRSLEALRAQTRPPDRIVLVDNGSTDGSPAMVRERFPEVEIVELGRNAGFAAANNAGARAADDCDLIAMLNADAFPEPGWLEALVAAADAHPECASFASLMRRANEPELLDGTGDCYHVSGLAWQRDHLAAAADAPAVGRAGEIFSACAGAALYRRDAFLEVGGFDESYFVFYEDVDLGFKLRLAGHRAWYCPDAVVHHVGSGTTGATSEFSVYHAQRNQVWTWVRDTPLPLLLLYLPWHLAANAIAIVSHAQQGHLRTVARAKLDALAGLPRVLRERRRVQAARRASPWELRRAMARGWDVAEVMPTLARIERRVRS